MTYMMTVYKIQTHERFKRTLFIRTRQNQQIVGVIPFVELQNDILPNTGQENNITQNR